MFGLSFVFSQLFFVFSTSTVIPMSTEFFCDDNTRYNDIVDLPDLGSDEIDAGNTNLCSGFIENELCVPQDSLDDIEWYPNFTDDLISWNYLCWSPKQEHKLCFPITPEQTNETHVEDKTRASSNGEYCAKVAHNKRKQRSKRSQKQHVWSTKNVDFGRGNDNDDDEEVSYVNKNNSYSKVLKKRICTHCMTDTTPQWRMGPKGPNTLCNACGVRYKSGRLVPEYRPANSPTFDSLKHSNFYKKITKRRERRFSAKQ